MTTRRRSIFSCLCFAMKAVHLEPTNGLTIYDTLEALKGSMARRGVPRCLYSDNGTGLLGARRQLCQFKKMFEEKWGEETTVQRLLNLGIHWKSIPPAGPHRVHFHTSKSQVFFNSHTLPEWSPALNPFHAILKRFKYFRAIWFRFQILNSWNDFAQIDRFLQFSPLPLILLGGLLIGENTYTYLLSVTPAAKAVSAKGRGKGTFRCRKIVISSDQVCPVVQRHQ